MGWTLLCFIYSALIKREPDKDIMLKGKSDYRLTVYMINYSTRQCMQTVFEFTTGNAVHRGAFCQFTLQWIYYCHSSISTGKETDKTHLCAAVDQVWI